MEPPPQCSVSAQELRAGSAPNTNNTFLCWCSAPVFCAFVYPAACSMHPACPYIDPCLCPLESAGSPRLVDRSVDPVHSSIGPFRLSCSSVPPIRCTICTTHRAPPHDAACGSVKDFLQSALSHLPSCPFQAPHRLHDQAHDESATEQEASDLQVHPSLTVWPDVCMHDAWWPFNPPPFLPCAARAITGPISHTCSTSLST